MSEFGQILRLSVRPSSYPLWYKIALLLVAVPSFAVTVGLIDMGRNGSDAAFIVFGMVALIGAFLLFQKIGAF